MLQPPSKPTTARLRFEQIFEELSATFAPYNGFSRAFNPEFWTRVFIAYYGSAPSSIEDPRWEELFALRYPRRRRFNALHT